MNPDSRACSRKEGPNCQHLIKPIWSWCVNSTCRRYPGVFLQGGVTDCSYYKPIGSPRDKVARWCEWFALAGLVCFYVTLTVALIWSLV
jgi:hypothetical protein